MITNSVLTKTEIRTLEECKQISLYDVVTRPGYRGIQLPQTNDETKLVAIITAELVEQKESTIEVLDGPRICEECD